MDKLLSASEIAKLKLPGIPTTRAAVNVMAKREGWEYETITGIGGQRRMYRVPAKYFGIEGAQELPSVPGTSTATPIAVKVVGAIAAGSSRVDIRKLELAIQALGEWETTRNVSVAAERRPAVIAVLYDFLVKSDADGAEGLDVVLRALG